MTDAKILQMPIHTKLVCSACGAPGEGSCRCNAPYVTPGQRAEDAVKAHPEKSDRAIAEELGVSDMTVGRARKRTATNVAVEKRTGRDGKSRKPPKPRSRPVEDRARQAVRDKVIAGKPVNARKIGEDTGISHVMVEQATAAERARLEVLKELNVDPQTLAPSAQAKLEIAKRTMQVRLNAEHAARMRALDEEVRQRVLKEGKEYLAELQKERNEIQEEKKLYREWKNNGKPLYTIDEFNLIRKCLHQGGVAAKPKDFDVAFDLIQKKKLQLTGQK